MGIIGTDGRISEIDKSEQKKRNSFQSFCSWLIALSPILDPYYLVFLPGVPIDYLLFFAAFILLLFKIKSRSIAFVRPQLGPVLVVSLLLFISILGISTFGFGINFIADFGKILMWGSSIFFFSGFIDKKNLTNAIIKVSLFNSLIVLIQSFGFYLFNIRLPNVFDLGLINYKVISMDTFVTAYRPAGLFSEPAAFSVFAIIALSILLLWPEVNNANNFRGRRWKIVMIVLALILSASTTGLVLLIVLLAYNILVKFKNRPVKGIFFALPFVIASCFLVFNIDSIISSTGSFGQVINKSIIKVNNTESSARVGGSLDRIDPSDENFLFGYGVGNEYYISGNELVYLNSVTRSILQYGIIGTFFIFLLLVSNFLKSTTSNGRFLSFASIVLMFTSNTLFTVTSIVMFLVIYLLDVKFGFKSRNNNIDCAVQRTKLRGEYD